jgi:hypothetical protein
MGRTPGPTVEPARLLAVLPVLLVLVGCGSSLADADRPLPTRPSSAVSGDFCAAVRAGADAARPLAALVNRGGSVPRDQVVEAAERVRTAYADVLATAPEEIRSDVEHTLAEADMQLDDLEATGGDAEAVAQDTAMRSRQAGEDYALSAARVRDYVGAHCGVDSGRLPG